jgi:hypothetical protein
MKIQFPAGWRPPEGRCEFNGQSAPVHDIFHCSTLPLRRSLMRSSVV